MMMRDDEISVSDLRFDPKNARKHPKQNLDTLEKSLQETGAGRSILLAKDGTILAGNATVEIAAQAGFDTVRVVETDGKTLIAVKRMDLDPDDPRATKAALYDNLSAEQAEWDTDVLREFAQVPELDLDHIFSQGFLAELATTQDNALDDPWMPDADDARVKRWTFQFSNAQHELIRTALEQVVSAGLAEKTDENSDVYGNALAYLIERQVYDPHES